MHMVEGRLGRSKPAEFQGYSVVGNIKGDERDVQVPCKVEECVERK